MKILNSIRLITTLMICFFVVTNLAAAKETTKAESCKIKTSEISLEKKDEVKDMLLELDGVKSVCMDLDKKEITVSYLSRIISPDMLVHTLDEAGYEASLLKDETELKLGSFEVEKKLNGSCQ